jgi:hypothetical protein
MNAARAVDSLCPSADTDVVAQVVPAHAERMQRSEWVAMVATFTEGPTAGLVSLQQGGAWQSERAARAG